MQTAVRTEVTDASLHAYIQQHPFLTGPDEATNLRALQAVRAGIRISVTEREVPLQRRPTRELMLPLDADARACATLRAIGMTPAEVEHASHDYSWRAARVPTSARSILCLGSGAGEELAFLRARAPQARLVVLDYVPKVRPGLLEAVGAEFSQCDLVAELRRLDEGFDAVFCNHTLEHMFEPDRVLALIAACLNEEGILVAGLPLDGDRSVPLRAAVDRAARAGMSLHAIDLGVFDAGHPWKTNTADLAEALERAGFTSVQMVQRADRPYRAAAEHDRTPSRLPRAWLEAACVGLFGSVRALLRWILPGAAPLALRRALVAAERRVPFGAGRLKNSFSPDVVVSATRRSPAVPRPSPR